MTTASPRWCVKSLDRDERGHVVGERWCALKRRVRGRRPRYRDVEETACCGRYVMLPAGYEHREPTCTIT